MTLKELEDKWHYSRLSPLGKELWDSFADGEWFYPSNQHSYGEEPMRTHVEHHKTKIRLAMTFKYNSLNVYSEHGPAWHFVLSSLEQKILLKRFRECVNKQLAFRFQIAPFKNEQPF